MEDNGYKFDFGENDEFKEEMMKWINDFHIDSVKINKIEISKIKNKDNEKLF